MAAQVSANDAAPVWKREKKQYWDFDGNPLDIEGGPHSLCYDEDGLPVCDFDIVEDAPGEGTAGPDGRRRGARIVGAIDLNKIASKVTRSPPDWGKRFGLVRKTGVGFFGAYTIEEAKLCLTTEDFGFKIPDHEKHLMPYAPVVRLCYGELHGEPESMRLFTGLSEIHMLKDADFKETHYMLHKLGYVCYNHPMNFGDDRYWGEGIDAYPQGVHCGMPGGKGPMFYSWYYRLPPWMPGLALEGEDGDYISGPIAMRRKAKEEKDRIKSEQQNEENLIKLKARVQELRLSENAISKD
jgi:hypothetical protein